MAPDSSRRLGTVALIVVVGCTLIGQLPSLRNGFAFDDVHIIVANELIHRLSDLPARLGETYWPPVPLGPAGRLYRPLTMMGFALQWAVGGGSPLVFHLTSVLGSVLVAALVYALARRFLPPGPSALAGVWFGLQPVHVEAVANVVGQAELLAAGWCLLAAILYLDGRRAGLTPRRLAQVGICYLLGCLAKEHAVVLPALLLALEPALDRGSSVRQRALVVAPAMILLGVIGVGYLAVRSRVVGPGAGDLPHVFWRGVSADQRIFTMLALVPTVLRLLTFPWHLQADYAPAEVTLVSDFGGPAAIGLACLLVISIGCLALIRRWPAVTVGFLWAAVALLPTANLLIPTGIVLAERTLYLPSIGVALLVGSLGQWVGRKGEALRLTFGAVAIAGLGVLGWRSIIRQPVWRDNPILYRQTIIDAPKSYLAWRNWGGELVLEGRLTEAEAAYRRSLTLFDRDANVFDELAGVLRRRQHCEASVPLLDQALELDPTRHQTAGRLVGCLVTLHRFADAREVVRGRATRGWPQLEGLLPLIDSAEAVR